MPIDVAAWLAGKGVRIRPQEGRVLSDLLDPATPLPRTAAGLPMPTSTLWYQLAKRRLPRAGRWLQLARCLAVLEAVREGEPLTTLAQSVGYADHGGLGHLLRRELGLTAAEIRARGLSHREAMELWWSRAKAST